MILVKNLILFTFFALSVAKKDSVPVLILSAKTIPYSNIFLSGLNKLDTDDFYNYFLKKVHLTAPNIVLFVEENLSVEDFSWRDDLDQGAFPLMSNLTKTGADVMFFPSVYDPYEALRKLKFNGYKWKNFNSDTVPLLRDDEPSILMVKLSEPYSLEDRPDFLRSHDMEIAKIYNNIMQHTSNFWVVYTANHSSWLDVEKRVKRSDMEYHSDDASQESTSEPVLLTDNNKTILILTQKPIVLWDGSEFANLSETTINPTVERKADAIVLDVNFKYKKGKPEIDFYFNGSESSSWKLSHAILNEMRNHTLFPNIDIEAPKGYSFTCFKKVIFADKESKIYMELNHFQVQPFAKDGRFGTPIDCVPYFSIAIWTGLSVVLILTVVLSWGIMMMIEINTMDRFDDPKGKTITISATD